MPVNDTSEARDLLFGAFATAWATITPTPPPVVYQDKAGEKPNHAPYAEVEIQHGDQRGVAIGDAGRKRLRAAGRLIVAIHTVPGDGLTAADAYVKIVQNAFEQVRNIGGPEKVTIRRVAVVEDGTVGDSTKTRVIVYFDYDRVQSRT